MDDKTLPEYLLKLCRAVQEELSEEGVGFLHQNSGLCSLLSWADDHEQEPPVRWPEVSRYKDLLMARWPESSGSRTYPVTVPWEDLSEDEQVVLEQCEVSEDSQHDGARALFEAVDSCELYDGNFWDKDTLYGAARWRLLAWMIEELEKEVGDA